MSSALAQIFDLFIRFIDSFRFLTVVKAWEVAVVLRLGVYHRTLKPGLHFVFPFHIEAVSSEWTTPYPRLLSPQALTTADGVQVVVTALVTTRCVNAQTLVCQSGGHEAAILDSAGGTIGEHVGDTTWADIHKREFTARLTKAVDTASREWGLECLRVQLVQLSKARPVVIVGHKATDLQ